MMSVRLNVVDTLDSGHRQQAWTPQRVQRPPDVSGPKSLFYYGFQQVAGGCQPGWLPKKPALSLAIRGAKPASIRW
jgi:hypothetical protein